MGARWAAMLLFAWVGLVPGAGQAPSAPPVAASNVADPVVAAAELWIGRALLLRATPAVNELHYDRSGHLLSAGKTVDWTLAGINLEKVARHGADELELDGTRVAIRYNPDQHQFDRHALKDVHLKLIFPASDAAALNKAMSAIFSTGIDPAFERAMPPAWRHYFLPGSDWQGADVLAGASILPAAGRLPEGTVLPEAEKKPEPEYTDQARADRVKGTVGIRLVVDTDGVPRRITIRQPLGYGLDARTAEAVARWRFRPGTVGGRPAAMEVLVNQAFDFVAPPR